MQKKLWKNAAGAQAAVSDRNSGSPGRRQGGLAAGKQEGDVMILVVED